MVCINTATGDFLFYVKETMKQFKYNQFVERCICLKQCVYRYTGIQFMFRPLTQYYPECPNRFTLLFKHLMCNTVSDL